MITILAMFRRLPATWRAVVMLAAIAGAGFGASKYLDRFAEKDDIGGVRERVRLLEVSQAATAESVAAIRTATENTREDIGRLLDVMLKNPPGRQP